MQIQLKELSPQDTRLGWLLLCTHILFMYARPQEILTFLRPLHLPGLVALGLTFWVIKNFDKKTLQIPSAKFVFVFGGLSLVSLAWSNHSIAFTIGFTWLIQYLPVTLAVILLVRDSTKYKTLLFLWCSVHAVVFFVVFKNGGKGPGDFMADENDAALGIAMAMPIILYFASWPDLSTKQKLFLKTLFFVACAAIIATRSRGGFLGLLSALGMIWLFSRSKMKILFTCIILGITAGSIAIQFLPEGYLEDLQGISDPNDSTRSERIETWEIAWIMFKDNPIWGVGAGNFPWNVKDYQEQASWWFSDARSLHGRQTHSMYFQLLADVALIGMILYFGFLLKTMSLLFKAQKNIYKISDKLEGQNANTVKGLGMICRALYISIFPYLVSGAFVSVGYYPHIVMWGTLAYTTLYILDQHSDSIVKNRKR